MGRALFVIDPQYDFINGALPVPGASEAMDKLAQYIYAHAGSWDIKIVTMDHHTWRHCSFADCGGRWPRHAVAHTHGASLWQNVAEALHETVGPVRVFGKGVQAAADHYSVFQAPIAAKAIDDLFRYHKVDTVDVCGLAGDICVLDTLKDMVARYPGIKFNVMSEFAPSLDGGGSLQDFCKEKELVCAK